MIGRKTQYSVGNESDAVGPQGFDDFVMKLGDVMRGERATLGKSLLDVQRELRIKASYIAAIENCDPSAFDTPGFIAGYVRSYARYLNMDPDETFAAFCAESGFAVAHGMSEKASTIRKSSQGDGGPALRARDPFAEPSMPFAPSSDSFLSRVEPGAVGSTLVLLALIGGIGYGGYAVLQEVQRVQVSPVEQTPLVLSELDPLDGAGARVADDEGDGTRAGLFTPPKSGAFDRLYRPQALDVPVLTSRDGPISTLDPDSVGLFARAGDAALPDVQDSAIVSEALVAELIGVGPAVTPGVLPAGVTVIAARPAWVRVSDAERGVLYTEVMDAGATYTVPDDAVDPLIRVGASGAVYFAVNGQAFGPAGPRGTVTNGISLNPDAVTERYSVADLDRDADLGRVVAALDLRQPVLVAEAAAADAAAEEPKLSVAERVAQATRALPQLRAFESPATPNAPIAVEPLMPELDFADLDLTDTARSIDDAIRPAPRSEAVVQIGETMLAEAKAEQDALQLAEAERVEPVAPLVVADLVAPVTPVQQAERLQPVQPVQQAERLQPVQPAIPQPRVLADALPGVTIIATAEAWVEVTAQSGTKLIAKLMLPGDTLSVPQTEEPPTIFTGDAGAIFFAVNGQTFGPYGERGQFGRNLTASAADVQQSLAVADMTRAPELQRIVAELNAASLRDRP